MSSLTVCQACFTHAARRTRIILGAIGELLTALAGIGTAVAVYPVIRRQTKAFSLGFVTNRIYEAAVMVIGVIALLTIVSLRQEGAVAGSDITAMTAYRPDAS